MAGDFHECFLQGGAAFAQELQLDFVHEGNVANVGRVLFGDVEGGPVFFVHFLGEFDTGRGEHFGHAIVVGGAHQNGGGRVFFNEVVGGAVGHEFAAANDDEMVGGLRHFTQQVRADQHSAALGGQGAQEFPHPADALRVEAVDGFVEDEDFRVTE